MSERVDQLEKLREIEKRLGRHEIYWGVIAVVSTLILSLGGVGLKAVNDAKNLHSKFTAQLENNIEKIDITAKKAAEEMTKKILNLGPAHDQNKNSLRIVTGETPPGFTLWQTCDFGEGLMDNCIFTKIDTKSANFKKKATYFTSLSGNNHHWTAMGTTSIYYQSIDGFVVFVYYPEEFQKANPTMPILTPKAANDRGWRINWIGIGI